MPGARALALLDGGDRRRGRRGSSRAARRARGRRRRGRRRPRARSAGGVVDERALDLGGEVERRVELLQPRRTSGRQALGERLARRRAAPGASVRERQQVARAGGAERDPARGGGRGPGRGRAPRAAGRGRARGRPAPRRRRAGPGCARARRAGRRIHSRSSAAAHGGLRLVEHVEQRAAPAAVGQVLDELEVAARERVDRRARPRRRAWQRRDVGEVALLRLAHVAQGGARRGRGARQRLAAEGLERRDAEVGEQLAARALGLERRGPRSRRAGSAPSGCAGSEQPRGQLGVAAAAGSRAGAGAELVAQRSSGRARPTRRRRTRRSWARARRRPGWPVPASIASTNEVSAASSACGFELRAGRDDAHDLALDDALGVRGSSICSQSATRWPCRTSRAM